MNRRSTAFFPALLAIPLTLYLGARAGAAPQRPQVPGTIRTGVTVVPIDVRVLDRNRRPVTDLKQADFTVLEDGIVREIGHFSAHGLTPESPEPGGRPAFRRADGSEVKPRNRRTFVIVLGRGRLQHPSKGMDALVVFVRERLLPQDYVAVVAFNRATDFTTEHAKVARVLERFHQQNDAIESRLGAHFSGLQAVYGSKAIPPRIQAAIDDVFHDPETPGFRTLPSARLGETRIAEDMRRETRELIDAATGLRAGLVPVVDIAEFFDLRYDAGIFNQVQTRQDLESLFSAIEYLRYLEGEKHLIFVTERGLFLPRLENDKSIAALANDARVAIHTIQTGGLDVPPSPFAANPFRSFRPRARVPGLGWTDRWAIQSLANISEFTGGVASRFSYADVATRRIDDATRFNYLLGYAPSDTNADGRYRRITVRVNRPGVTVLFRHGYLANAQLVPYDREQFMTYNRIVTAGNHTQEIRDIQLTLEASMVKAGDGGLEVAVDLRIDTARVAFADDTGAHVAALEVAIFCGDRRQNVIGELWQTIDLKLSAEARERAARDGIRHSARVPVKAAPRYVKAIVYDRNADVVGTTAFTLR